LLALVVLLDAAQAGRGYIYCSAMQEVMDHACCQKHQASSSTPLLTTGAPECCQDRVVPALGAWTPIQRSVTVPPAAVWLAVVARPLVDFLAPIALHLRREHPTIQSRPPLLRVLALLMVFRL
jgi:hypothetical protein